MIVRYEAVVDGDVLLQLEGWYRWLVQLGCRPVKLELAPDVGVELLLCMAPLMRSPTVLESEITHYRGFPIVVDEALAPRGVAFQ